LHDSLLALVNNGIDADFEACLKRVKDAGGWNDAQEMPAEVQGAVLRFCYACPKASEFEDGHFFALASKNNKLRFQDKAQACRFFQIISDDTYKATKQDEMVGKYYFCKKNPNAECIPHALSRKWQNATNRTPKPDPDSTRKPDGKRHANDLSEGEFVVVAEDSSKKTKHHVAETPRGSGNRAGSGTTGNRSSNSGGSGKRAGRGNGKNASGNRSSNGSKNSTTKKLQFKEDDAVVKSLTFQPHQRQYRLFPFSYSGKPIPDDMDPMVPFRAVCSSLSSFPYGAWFVTTNKSGVDEFPAHFIKVHRQVYLNTTTLLGIRVVLRNNTWVPESDYKIPADTSKSLDLLFRQQVPYALFEERINAKNFDSAKHITKCKFLGNWYEKWINEMDDRTGFVQVVGKREEVKHAVKDDGDPNGLVVYDHYVLHRIIAGNPAIVADPPSDEDGDDDGSSYDPPPDGDTSSDEEGEVTKW
jgi:hypothetical protein